MVSGGLFAAAFQIKEYTAMKHRELLNHKNSKSKVKLWLDS